MATALQIGYRFRAINDWCGRNVNLGFVAGWPNFHAAEYPNPRRIVYGYHLLRDAVVDWRDVPAAEYGAVGVRTRFTGAHDYALRSGYQQGFPNWHEANYGQGVVYGTFLIVPGTCVWRDVAAFELGLGYGDPTAYTMDYWFRGAADYASRSGFAAGMPNGHYANYGAGWVCGTFLFPQGTVEWRDIRGRELGLPDLTEPAPPPPPPPPPEEPPPPRNMTQFWLDYDSSRITRVGRSQGPWVATRITSVVNRTQYTFELGVHRQGAVFRSTIINAGASSGHFNGLDATQDWVGVGANGVKAGVGPFEINYDRV
jgi:hypothetical protein